MVDEGRVGETPNREEAAPLVPLLGIGIQVIRVVPNPS